MNISESYEEAGRYASFNEWRKEVFDSTGVCTNAGIDTNKIVPALNYATGSDFTADSIVYEMGRKLLNIAKGINSLRKGFTREHDTPRARALEFLPLPNYQARLEMEPFNEQLDKYYDYHGWDKETSWQKGSTLLDLGLPGLAWELWKEGKLK
jgi:aldehyde:ferredoxin oxidoreductase